MSSKDEPISYTLYAIIALFVAKVLQYIRGRYFANFTFTSITGISYNVGWVLDGMFLMVSVLIIMLGVPKVVKFVKTILS